MMNRIKIYSILLCILCLLPVLTQAQTLTQYEYWFDDDFANRQAVSLSGANATIDVDIDASSLGTGLHRFHLRFQQSDGMYSAVTSNYFFKAQMLEGGILEYWFDDNKDASKKITGQLASDGKDYVFNTLLDVTDISMGSHRFYYRVVNTDGTTCSPVSMTPVMLHSRYNVKAEDLTVEEQSYWFDDEEPEIVSVSRPKNIKNLSRALDARKLSDGQHTLHMQWGNSAGIWNGPVEFTFTKSKVSPPVISANADLKDGIVTFRFNSIPYGQSYALVRQYPSGKERKVDDVKTTEYPAALQFVDKPALGTYTYYIDGGYIDADGKTQSVRSGEMSVTVDSVATDVKRGSIYGRIKNDGFDVGPGTFFSVYINGEGAVSQKQYGFFYDSGSFCIYDVPYGTEMTIGIKQDHYKFEDLTLIVNENTSKNTYRFNGLLTEEDEDDLPDDAVYDLSMSDKIHLTPNAWEVKVYNKSSKTWSGNLIVKVISKQVKDLYDRDAEGDVSMLYKLFHPNAGLDGEPVFKTGADGHVNLEGKKTRVLELDIVDLPDLNKNEDFYVYVFSKKDGSEQMKELDALYRNPQVLTFNPYNYAKAFVERAATYRKAYAEVLKWMKKFSAWGDPFKLAYNTVTDKAFNNYIRSLEKDDVDLSELNKDIADAAISSAGLLLNCFFKDMSNVVKNQTRLIKESEIYKITENLSALYDYVNGAYNASLVNENHRFFELAKLVLKYSNTDPMINCYKTYFEVGEAMVSAIERLENSYSRWYLFPRLISGQGVYKIKIRKYTGDKNKVEYFRGEDFYPTKNSYHPGQIQSISIGLKAPSTPLLECIDYKIELDDDGITIRDVEFPLKNNNDDAIIEEAWMTITWKNKRITYVPLLDENFVKLQNFSQTSNDPPTMTVELQSESYLNVESIPNKIQFVKPSTSWFDF